MEGYRKLDSATEDLFEHVLTNVAGEFLMERKEIAFGISLLSSFSSLGDYERLYIHKVTEFKSASNSFIILLLEKHLTLVKQLPSGHRYSEEVEEVEPLLFFTLPMTSARLLSEKKRSAIK